MNTEDNIPMREMDLAEILATLPQGHKARIQFGELTARLSEEKDKVFELERQAELSFNENATFQIKGGHLVFDGSHINTDDIRVRADGKHGVSVIAHPHHFNFAVENDVIMNLSKDKFTYKGETIDDVHGVYDAMVEFFKTGEVKNVK